MSDRKIIKLVDLDRDLGQIELPSGKVCDVHPIDGVAMQLVQELEAGGKSSLVWDILARCVKGATREDLLEVNIVQAKAVLELASGSAKSILDETGKDTGATEAMPAAAVPQIS